MLHLLVRSVAQTLLSYKELRQDSVKIPTHLFSFNIFAAKKKEEEEDDDMKELEAWAGTM